MVDEILEEVVETEKEEMLKVCQKISENMANLRELNLKQNDTMVELEYALYLKAMWETHGAYDGKQTLSPSFEWDGRTKGYFVLKRKDGAYQKYPVRVKQGPQYLNDAAAYGILDMWDESGAIPDRVFELFLTWKNRESKHAQRSVQKERERRLEREKHKKRPPLVHPQFLPGVIVHYPEASPLVEPATVVTPNDEVWTDSVPGDGGSPEVDAPEAEEGPQSETPKNLTNNN